MMIMMRKQWFVEGKVDAYYDVEEPGVQVLFHWQVIEMESTSLLSGAMNFRAEPQTYLERPG